MKRILTSDLISSVTGAGEKSLDFATDRGGARGLVSVYFSAENVHSIPPETIEANTRIASDYLDAEVNAGRQLQPRYELRNGQVRPR